MGIDRGARDPKRARMQFQRNAVGDGTQFGDGLVYDSDNDSLALALATVSGLAFSSGGLTIDLRDTTPCLELDATGIGVILPSSSGLERTASGLTIDLQATPGLTLGASGIAVLLDPTEPGLQLTSGLKVLLAANGGLDLASGLTVDLRDTTPCLELDATGVGVIVGASGGLRLTAGGLALDDFAGTVFPTTGLYAGYKFFRTDLNEAFIYNGTTWLGEVFTIVYGRNTTSFFPGGTFVIQPVGTVTAAKPHGYPVFQDCKVIGMQFRSASSWTGTINLYIGTTLLHGEAMSAVEGFAVDLDEDVDASGTDGLYLEGVNTSGKFEDGICFVKIRRRIDP